MRTLLLLGIAAIVATAATADSISSVLGVTHAPGTLGPNAPDPLNAGADEARTLGVRTIKLWFENNPGGICTKCDDVYPLHDGNGNVIHWGPFNSITDLAKSPPYDAVFHKDFATYVLETFPNKSFELSAERTDMSDLTYYLIKTFNGTGKTFILQNWEGDWALSCCDRSVNPTEERISEMIDWLNARQDGVSDGRLRAALEGFTNVHVYHAAEANLITDPERTQRMVNRVIPYTHCDLYSYSAWNSGTQPSQLIADLDTLARNAPPSAVFGRRNVYVGEFGSNEVPDNPDVQPTTTRRLTEAALAWGARYILFWQLYGTSDPAREDAGLYLIRPDGTLPPVYTWFHDFLLEGYYHVDLRSQRGFYVSAINGGGAGVAVSRPWSHAWEFLTLIDPNGGALQSGDHVSILSDGGWYFSADNNGGGTVDASQTWSLGWEQFVLQKATGGGVVGSGDQVTLQTGGGYYLGAQSGGGGESLLQAASATAGAQETFLMTSRNDADPVTAMLVEPRAMVLPPAGGQFALYAEGVPGLPWTVTSGATFVSSTTTGGSGADEVYFTMAANTTGRPRTGAVTIGGVSVAIGQSSDDGPMVLFSDGSPDSSRLAAGWAQGPRPINSVTYAITGAVTAGPAAAQGLESWFIPPFTIPPGGVATVTVTVTDDLGRSTSAQRSITQGPRHRAVRFAISAPSTTTAGSPLNIAVTALDADGNVINDYIEDVFFSSSDPAAALPQVYGFAPADGGQHTFSVTLQTPGTVAVTTTEQGGPASGSALICAVPAMPEITSAPAVCVDTTDNTASVPANANMQYQWSITGGQITSATTQSAITYTATNTSLVTLSVTVSNSCGTAAAATRNVTVASRPTATLSGGGAIVNDGSVTIHVALTGTSPWTVAWSDGLTQSVNGSFDRSVTQAGNYSVTVSDANCNAAASSESIVVTNAIALTAPALLSATTQDSNTRVVRMQWTAVADATGYRMERATCLSCGWAQIGPIPIGATSYDDTVNVGTFPAAYLYRVIAVASGRTDSPPSPIDFAVTATMLFAEPIGTNGVTAIKGTHVQELRKAIDALRISAGLPPYMTPAYADGWADYNPASGLVLASHIGAMRTALAEAVLHLTSAQMTFTGEVPSHNSRIYAYQFTQLRTGVK
jgi:hypothetical protein